MVCSGKSSNDVYGQNMGQEIMPEGKGRLGMKGLEGWSHDGNESWMGYFYCFGMQKRMCVCRITLYKHFSRVIQNLSFAYISVIKVPNIVNLIACQKAIECILLIAILILAIITSRDVHCLLFFCLFFISRSIDILFEALVET